MMRPACIAIFLILCFSHALGGIHDIVFSHIGMRDGLSHSTVNGITQDGLGYMWVATPDGLNRYDGYKFTTYYPDSVDRNIKDVAAGADGSLWALTAHNLIRYSTADETFTCYPLGDDAVLTVLQPVDGSDIAVGTTAGLYMYNGAESKFSLQNGTSGRHITALAMAGADLVAGTIDGTVLYPAKDGATAVAIPGGGEINTIKADRGVLMIGTEGRGLYACNPSDGRAVRVAGDKSVDYVRSLLTDRQGRLWVGTFTGLYVLDPDRRKVVFHEDATAADGALSHSSVRRMVADSQGGIWLGTYFGGLNYYHPQANRFTTLRKHNPDGSSISGNVAGPMAEDKWGYIWIGTNNGGLNFYNPATGTFRKLDRSGGLGSDDVKAIYIDHDARRAYIGTHTGGLSLINMDKRSVTTDRSIAQSVYDILPAKRPGCLWLATLDEGISLYDTATGVARMVRPEGMPSHTTNLMRDSRGRLWVSGEEGLAVYDENDGVLTPVPDMPAISFHIDDIHQSRTTGIFWIATRRGLYSYDSATGATRRYDSASGFPGDIIYAVLEDPNGQIWATTNRGLVCLNPETGSVMTYSSRDGLDNSQFTDRSALSAANGLMYFGGIDGVTYFNPSVLEKNTYAPAPVIEGVRLFNEPVTPGDRTGILSGGIHEADELRFDADQTNFTIDFTVCDYISKGGSTFRYMLEGIDKQWITPPPGVRSVSYSKLPSGSYTFRLRAANNDGVWSADEASLGIVIRPPWYRTWWAILAMILLAVAAAYFAIRYVWKRKSREKQRKAQEEVNEMKVRFFVNMSHELRTPLTLMLLPVNELIASHPDPATMQKLTTVRNNTLRIRHIVDQLLDYRRAELGMFRLGVAPLDLGSHLSGILEPYRSLAQSKHIKFRFDTTAGDVPVYADANYLELIVNNLVTNAFKYTPDGGEVAVDAAVEQGSLRITVADSGCGIPADKLDTIFTRFYQLNDSVGGYGIGLSLVKRLVELHHGTISVKSEVGHGSVFTVVLPAEASAYAATEIVAARAASSAGREDVTALLPVDGDSESAAPADADGRKTVMVVDDNAEILKYLAGALSGEFRVLTAANGTKAIELLGADTIDLVISDVMMPDMDGVQLCRAIKRNLRTSHIPVILLSAKADVADRLDGLKVGADDYIAKPFSMEELIAKVRNQIRTRESIIRHYSQSPGAPIEPAKVAQNPLDEEFLSKAVKVMAEHLDDCQFSTDEFARQMCMSRSNLHLKMKALTGESTNDFIRRTRLRKAAELLQTRRYTVAEVSAMVGYSTPSYFATAFKSFFGHSPSSLLARQ